MRASTSASCPTRMRQRSARTPATITVAASAAALRPGGPPEAVDAAGVDQVPLGALQQQGQEHARAVVHAEPADVEGPLPVGARVADEAAGSADAGVVEHQVDVIGRVLTHDGVA